MAIGLDDAEKALENSSRKKRDRMVAEILKWGLRILAIVCLCILGRVMVLSVVFCNFLFFVLPK